MSFQDGAGNYTMVSHELAKEVGLVCAAVYGAVWRYCQMKDGVCRASLNTIGNDINLNRATVLRSIEKLSDLGYLIDQTPDRRNAPHTYVIGRTVVIRNSLEATTDAQEVETVAESNTLPVETVVTDNTTVAYNNSSIETVAQNNATVAECNATVAESYLNRVFKRDSNKDNKERESHAREEINNQILAVCGYDLKYLSAATGKKVNDTAAQLIAWGATVELIKEFSSYWWGSSPPTLKQLVDDWSKFMTQRQNPKKEQNGAKNGQQPTKDHRPEFEKRREAGQSIEDEFATQLRDLRGPNLAGLAGVPSRP